MAKTEPFYEKAYTCPLCQTRLKSLSVRSSFVRVVDREPDFHIIYDGISPLHYSIIVCPQCHYAAASSSFNDAIPSPFVNGLLLALNRLKRDEPEFGGVRDIATALRSYQLAIQSAQLRRARPGQLAGLLLGAAWIAREMKDTDLERSYMSEAVKNYEQSYVSDTLPVGNLDEVSMAYLIGELHRRLGNYSEAVRWFAQALKVRRGNTLPAIEKLIREQWRQARAEAAGKIDEKQDAVPEVDDDGQTPQPVINEDENKIVSTSRRRAKVLMNAHLYQDQVEWLTKAVNLLYNRGLKITREELLRAIVDSVITEIEPDVLNEIARADETTIVNHLKKKLADG